MTRIVSDNSTIVRLGEGVDKTRELQPQAIARTLACLKNYAKICRDHGVDPSRATCVGTSSSRDATNGKIFYAEVERETGFRFRVLSGDDEAKYTFLGGLHPGMDPSRSAVIDIGGGSTEIITQQGSRTVGMSLDIGSVRFTERFLKSNPVTDAEFWACQDAIDEALAPAVSWREKNPSIENFVAVAGTATTLAAWHLGAETVRRAQARRVRAHSRRHSPHGRRTQMAHERRARGPSWHRKRPRRRAACRRFDFVAFDGASGISGGADQYARASLRDIRARRPVFLTRSADPKCDRPSLLRCPSYPTTGESRPPVL